MNKPLALIIALVFALLPLQFVRAEGPPLGHDRNHIVVEINDGGFNGQTGDFTIEVNQGDLVELTFTWAHQGYLAEEHVMVLEGYKLEWDKLDADNREATLRFIADKAGTFTFKCDLKCDLHDYLQNGHLKVNGAGASGSGAASALRTATSLNVTPSAWETRGEPITLMTALKDANGAPVEKAQVRFFVDAEFAGVKNKMDIGSARTDANGVAFLDFKPTLATRQQKITALFEGMGVYGETKQSFEITLVGTPPPAYVVEPAGLEEIRHWAPLGLALVVGTVWALYGFVLFQIFGIFRSRARG